jgi:hypothetical protein
MRSLRANWNGSALPSLTQPGPAEGECGRPGASLLFGTRSAAGNPPGYPDPVVGGSLEDDFCDLIS